MKIFELYNPNMKREEFDLNDDLIFFMRNDPQFYRGEYHPFLQKFKRHCEAGRGVRPAAFAPVGHTNGCTGGGSLSGTNAYYYTMGAGCSVWPGYDYG